MALVFLEEGSQAPRATELVGNEYFSLATESAGFEFDQGRYS